MNALVDFTNALRRKGARYHLCRQMGGISVIAWVKPDEMWSVIFYTDGLILREVFKTSLTGTTISAEKLVKELK